MAITAGDLKLVAASNMTDAPEGGGAPSGTIIPAASSNGIFSDISELDRALGRVSMRKLFASVRTPDVEGFFGAHMIVAEPFKDPRVSALLFSTGNYFDRRAAAAARMESYLARGAVYQGYLFGNHLAGQSVVTLLQRLSAPQPVSGQTLVLVKNVGLPNEFVQFIRITDVTATERVFQDAQIQLPEFTRRHVVCQISDPLEQDFNGFDALRSDAGLNYTNRSQVCETVVADAGQYYGCARLTAPVGIGDFAAEVDSIYAQLVPSTRVEVPIADARMNQQLALPVASGADITRTVTQAFGAAQAMFLGGSITPGTLSITRGGVTLTDRGGLLMSGSTAIGTVDYGNGVIAPSSNPFGATAGAHAVAYRAAVVPPLVNRSIGIDVTAESQRMSYVLSLDPVPVPGSTQISYRVLGNWYVLTDDGSGALRGSDSSAGAGSLNPTTGTLSVTLGALPDIGTKILVTWGNPAKIKPVLPAPPAGGPGTAGPIDASPPSTAVPQKAGRQLRFSVPRAIKPGTVTVSWNDGTPRSVTDNSTRGLTGYGTGSVDYARGLVWWQPTTLPPKGTGVTLSIGEVSAVENTSVPPMTDGGATWILNVGPNVTPRSFAGAITWSPTVVGEPGALASGQQSIAPLYDNGTGGLAFRSNADGSEIVCGTIDYASGACTIVKSLAGITLLVERRVAVENASTTPPMRWIETKSVAATVNLAFNNQSVPYYAYTNSAADEAQSESITLDFVEYRLETMPPPTSSGGMAGVQQPDLYLIREFQLGPNHYTVVGESVVMNVSPTTGVGTPAGSYSPTSRAAHVTLWGDQSVPAAVTPPQVTQAAVVAAPADPAYEAEVAVAVFRTAVSPLVNGGFQVAGNYMDGTAFSAIANSAGVISTGSAADEELDGTLGVFGRIDYESGVAEIRWGRRTNTTPAADPFVADISHMGLPGVTYIRMDVVAADTLRYNAVGYSYLPLPASILGLNPVRLPVDGRVPIFKRGYVGVLGHAGIVGPAVAADGETWSAGRARLSRARLIDANDEVVDTGYTADLDAGTITFVDVSGYAQPVRFEHRIEDTVLIRDAQINGRLSFTRPSTHEYPVGAYLSSALVFGDVRARVLPAWDQQAWTGVWSDAPIGNSATGTFNDTLHPITTTNLGAITEQWAARFTGTTAFEVFGENVGVIAIGNTGTDCAPVNPATGEPYFTIPKEGWGGGWVAGNVVRWPTVAASPPVWVVRTVQQGPETVEEDDFTLLYRGDVDRP